MAIAQGNATMIAYSYAQCITVETIANYKYHTVPGQSAFGPIETISSIKHVIAKGSEIAGGLYAEDFLKGAAADWKALGEEGIAATELVAANALKYAEWYGLIYGSFADATSTVYSVVDASSCCSMK